MHYTYAENSLSTLHKSKVQIFLLGTRPPHAAHWAQSAASAPDSLTAVFPPREEKAPTLPLGMCPSSPQGGLPSPKIPYNLDPSSHKNPAMPLATA